MKKYFLPYFRIIISIYNKIEDNINQDITFYVYIKTRTTHAVEYRDYFETPVGYMCLVSVIVGKVV